MIDSFEKEAAAPSWGYAGEDGPKPLYDFVNSSLHGGMLGGYLDEPDMPFYFINEQLLNYLGYERRGEFLAATGGKIANRVHPDERAAVMGSLFAQMESSDEYLLAPYRMLKKDGGFIWVTENGKRITAGDGRPAAVCLCIDVSAVVEAQERLRHGKKEMENILNSIPGESPSTKFQTVSTRFIFPTASRRFRGIRWKSIMS